MCKDKRKKLIEKYKTLDVSTRQEKKKYSIDQPKKDLGWIGLRNEYKNSCKELSDITKAADRDRKRLELVAEQIKKDFGF